MPRRTLLLAAAICFVVAVLATLWVVRNRQTPPQQIAQEAPKVRVFAALRDLPKGARIASTDLAVREVPVDQAPSDAVTDIAQAVNAILLQEVRKDEPLRLSLLIPPPEQLREFRVPLGLRGFVLYQPFTEGAADMLLPGDLVDVIATKRVGDTTLAEVIVQRAQVLVAEHYTPGVSREQRLREAALTRAAQTSVVGATPEPRPDGGSQTAPPPQAAGAQQPATMRRIVLAVTPQESVRLARALEEGRALTVLRNERDFTSLPPLRSPRVVPTHRHEPPPARPAPLRPAPVISAPFPPPRPVQTVVVYRGTQREEVLVSR